MREAMGRGRTVEEAVDQALALIGLSRAEVGVEVVQEAQRGLFGLGAREAVVRVVARLEKGRAAAEFIRRVGDLLELPLRVVARRQGEVVEVEVSGEGVGVLIGRRGETLEALQFLSALASYRLSGGDATPVVVDVEQYRRRRVEGLENLARRVAERVAREGREATLRPMTAAERRVVHLALRGDPRVVTFSRGEGPARHVVIAPPRR